MADPDSIGWLDRMLHDDFEYPPGSPRLDAKPLKLRTKEDHPYNTPIRRSAVTRVPTGNPRPNQRAFCVDELSGGEAEAFANALQAELDKLEASVNDGKTTTYKPMTAPPIRKLGE